MARGAVRARAAGVFAGREVGEEVLRQTGVRGAWLRRDGDRWVLHYDPRIALPFRAATPEATAADEVALWSLYDHIRCPTLVIRGADSDLLSRATLQEMARRGPKAQTVEIEGTGHAPSLMRTSEIAIVRDFLLGA